MALAALRPDRAAGTLCGGKSPNAAKALSQLPAGWVYRNEKAGPGRFRQFMQFDADTVDTASPAADAEVCMMAADTMEALGVPRGTYVVKVNNRKVLNGVKRCARHPRARTMADRLRAVDKLDRLGTSVVQNSWAGAARIGSVTSPRAPA